MNTIVVNIGSGRWLTSARRANFGALLKWRTVSYGIKSSALFLFLLIVITFMLVPLNLIQGVLFGRTSTVLTSTSALSGNKLKQDLSKGTGLTTCVATEKPSTDEFSVCPSYKLDFHKMSSNDISNKYFNVFKGLSETNNEAQIYTSDKQNVRVENGSLVLEARNNIKAGPAYSSARLDTKGKKNFKYGRLVVRAKMPAGIGTWPAIWMLPSQPKYVSQISSNESAYLADGEIDIAESIGREPNVVYSVTHSLSYDSNGVDRTYFNTIEVPGNDKNYHNYEVEWTPNRLTFKVDGVTFHSYEKRVGADFRSWPYDQSYYLVMNLALGGNWAGKDRQNFPTDGVDPAALPTSLRVESVSYYSYIGS